jgi:hypothetical protein
VLENSLYALGGYADASIDLVQRLSLDRLTWELVQLRLPQVGSSIVSFKDTGVYLLINKTTPSLPSMSLRSGLSLKASRVTVSFYCRGTLYCSYHD